MDTILSSVREYTRRKIYLQAKIYDLTFFKGSISTTIEKCV